MPSILILLSLIVGMTVGPSQGGQDQIEQITHGGQYQLLQCDESQIKIRDGEETKTLSNDSVHRIRFNDPIDPDKVTHRIQLVDGSVLLGARFQLADGKASIAESLDSETIHVVETRNIHFAELSKHQGATSEQWNAITQQLGQAGDRLVFQREAALDYLEGTVVAVTDESVTFQTSDRTAEASRARVNGLVFYHAIGRQFSRPTGILRTTSGSQLLIREAAIDNETLIVATICGASLRFPINELLEIDFASVRSTWISDIQPSTVDWQPLLYSQSLYDDQAALNQPRFNESFHHSPLELRFGQSDETAHSKGVLQFEHGLAVKGGTRLVFPLNQQYRSLSGVAGFDPKASRDGVVEMVVTADGNELVRKVLLHRDGDPQSLNLDVSGVNRLTIQVNYHDGRNVGDVIHFGDLKVVR